MLVNSICRMALLLLPATFLSGLFGINLGGMPGAESPLAFWIFCLITLLLGVWLKLRRWW